MNTQTKIQSIEQKIANLKKRKAQVSQQHLHAQVRLIQKCGLENLDPEILAGALLEIKQRLPQKQEAWLTAGERFLGSKKSAKSQKSANQNPEK